LRRRPWSDANDIVDAGPGIGLEPSLEMRLPSSYPLGSDAPEPILHNVMMEPTSMRGLLRYLRDMYEPGTDVGIQWGERCIEALECGDMTCAFDSGAVREDEGRRSAGGVGGDAEDGGGESTTPGDDVEFDGAGRTRTFVPPNGTRHGQPTRHFPANVVSSRSKYRVRDITRTPPFKPPRSGPSELMMATVCGVTCVEHVQWALAELLFNDKKASRLYERRWDARVRQRRRRREGVWEQARVPAGNVSCRERPGGGIEVVRWSAPRLVEVQVDRKRGEGRSGTGRVHQELMV